MWTRNDENGGKKRLVDIKMIKWWVNGQRWSDRWVKFIMSWLRRNRTSKRTNTVSLSAERISSLPFTFSTCVYITWQALKERECSSKKKRNASQDETSLVRQRSELVQPSHPAMMRLWWRCAFQANGLLTRQSILTILHSIQTQHRQHKSITNNGRSTNIFYFQLKKSPHDCNCGVIST